MSVLDTIRKVDERDPATARLLLGMALHEATCDEADRVRPHLERDVAKAMSRVAADGLRHLARQPASPSRAAAADALLELAEVAKAAGDDPATDYWDARGPDGKFVSAGRARSGIFNALGFATGKHDGEMQSRVQQTMGALTGSGPDAKYDRLRTLGQGLVATGDPTASAVGTVARLIGDIGPEAQRALEPGIRRSAYRYRGTERRPNAQLQAQVAAAVAELQGPNQDQERLRLTSRIGAGHLIGETARDSQIPDRDTASISLAAGKMPPSVGLMFDGRGRLVSEAMGYNGDHYLPFDLSNLKRLHGGSYVRTRTSGGPTDEDIYTGLMTGARHLTVVSNSGVFTLEFDPDLRGGRRYSDKARQMVDRYSRLVGAIGSGELYQTKLPQKEVQALRDASLRDAGGNAEVAETIFRNRQQAAMAAAAFSAPDDDELLDRAAAEVEQTGGGTGTFDSRVKEVFNRLKAEDRDKTARTYRLDGEGYKAAMKALKTEFPYFIRSATFLPLQDYIDSRKIRKPDQPRQPRGGTDLGYTPRGGLDPQRGGIRQADGSRKILGGPDPRVQARSGGVPQPSGGGAAPTPDGTPKQQQVQPASAGFDQTVQAALVQKQRQVATALSGSLRAVIQLNDASLWNELQPNKAGDGPVTEEQALADARSGNAPDLYVQWLDDQYKGDWGKIAEHILTSDNPKALTTIEKAFDYVDGVLDTLNVRPPNFSKDTFTAAKAALAQVQVLKKPFRPGADPTAEVPIGEKLPQALPEILGLGLNIDAVAEYAIKNPDVMAIALPWAKGLAGGGLTHEQLGEDVRDAAKRLADVRTAAQSGTLPPGLTTNDQQLVEDFKAAEAAGQEHPLVKEVQDLHRAWSLVRLHEVIEATGASASNTGAADPFAQARVGKSASPPSRVRWLSPAQEQLVAKAIARRSPSLRQVRVRVSH